MLAEVPLLSEETEQDVSAFQVEGMERSWSLLAIPGRASLLLFSQQPVDEPIVDLTLFSGEKRRPLTLFVDPVSSHPPAQLFEQLFEAQRQQVVAQEQRYLALQQQQQLKAESTLWAQWQKVLRGEAFSGWVFFLLLGGVIALLILRWWRSAEVVDLNQRERFPEEDHAPMHSKEGNWSEFQQGVAEIESRIQSPAGRG